MTQTLSQDFPSKRRVRPRRSTFRPTRSGSSRARLGIDRCFSSLCRGILLAALIVATATAGFGQEESTEKWDQQWFGTLEVQGVKLRMQVQVRKNTDGEWEGQLISLDQNNAKLPLGSYSTENKTLKFSLASPPASFEGKLNDAGDEAVGAWKQGGQSFDLSFQRSKGLPVKKAHSTWEGTMVAGERELVMVFRVVVDDEGKQAVELDSLTEGIRGIAGELTQDGNKVKVNFPNVGAVYEGTISDDEQSVDGTWKQGGASLDLDLKKTESAPDPEKSFEVAEVWTGTLEAGIRKLKLQFRIGTGATGDEIVLFDSLTEQLTGIEGTLERDGNKIAFKFPRLKVEISGELNESKDAIKATFNQSGVQLPLELTRAEKAETASDYKPNRPQMPKGPFPYKVIELEATNANANVTLSGTLTLPEGDGPFPAAILVSGSGPQDRDETLVGHKPFWVLADALTRSGIAVLRFDDRGTGKSTGEFSEATTEDFATDAIAWIDRLKSQDAINPQAIGIIGHSEGGLIAPLVADQRDDCAFIVMLAGPGITGEEIIYQQSRLIAEAEGAKPEDLDRQDEVTHKAIDLIRNAELGDDLSKELEALVDEAIASVSDEEREQAEANRSISMKSMQQMNTAWFRNFLFYDPVPTLKRVQCPVLALNGELDLQVPYEINLKKIEAALREGGNSDFVTKALPGLNHLFQHAETGSPTEYADIEETFDPETLKLIADWINARFGS